MKIIFHSMLFLLVVNNVKGQKDSTSVKPVRIQNSTSYFQSISGGLNALYDDSHGKGGFDMSVQSCHYFLITGKRIKNDSLHRIRVEQHAKLHELYNGVHFYILNRATIFFDSITSMATNFITSLNPSPFTFRIQKELFLTKQKIMSGTSYTPVISLKLIGDGRAVPFLQRDFKTKLGASAHFFLTLSSSFKRIEYDQLGKRIDEGIMYFAPTFGIAYGSSDLMRSVLIEEKNMPILSTGCRLGFQSEKRTVKDFSFLFNYSISEVIGSRLQLGVLLTSIK